MHFLLIFIVLYYMKEQTKLQLTKTTQMLFNTTNFNIFSGSINLMLHRVSVTEIVQGTDRSKYIELIIGVRLLLQGVKNSFSRGWTNTKWE